MGRRLWADWSLLPLSSNISERLIDDDDYISFRSVCSEWHSTAPMVPQAPLLLVEYQDEKVPLQICNLMNVEPLCAAKLPDGGLLGPKFVCGSSRGWIALVDHEHISLNNPFTGEVIALPSLRNFSAPLPDWFLQVVNARRADPRRREPFRFDFQYGSLTVDKLVLSSDPSDDTCIAIALCSSRRLIHCRPRGDDSWTAVPFNFTSIDDIICFEGHLYTACSNSLLFACPIGPHPLAVRQLLPAKPSPDFSAHRTYLVVSSRRLLLAVKIIEVIGIIRRYSWEVYRVKFRAEGSSLVRRKNLKGRALFLCNESVGISAAGSPGVKGDCIYFSEMVDTTPFGANVTSEGRIHLFDLETGGSNIFLSKAFMRSHWIKPNLCYEMGFKALQQCEQKVKLLSESGNYEDMMKAFRELLTFIKSSVTWNHCEKFLCNIIVLLSKSARRNTEVLSEFFQATLEALCEANNKRLWFKINLKRCYICLDTGEYGHLSEILEELQDFCQTKDPTDDHTKDTRLLEIMGIVHDYGGKRHMAKGAWADAAKDFSEAFKYYAGTRNRRFAQCFKYFILSNMLMESEVNLQVAEPYKNNPEILAMTNLAAAYQRNEILEFEDILKSNRTIMDDPLIHNYIEDLFGKIRTRALLELIKPYKKIRIPFIAKELNVSVIEAEQLLLSLILDDRIKGHIDQINQILERCCDSDRLQATKKYAAIQKLNAKLQALLQNITSRVGREADVDVSRKRSRC